MFANLNREFYRCRLTCFFCIYTFRCNKTAFEMVASCVHRLSSLEVTTLLLLLLLLFLFWFWFLFDTILLVYVPVLERNTGSNSTGTRTLVLVNPGISSRNNCCNKTTHQIRESKSQSFVCRPLIGRRARECVIELVRSHAIS